MNNEEVLKALTEIDLLLKPITVRDDDVMRLAGARSRLLVLAQQLKEDEK